MEDDAKPVQPSNSSTVMDMAESSAESPITAGKKRKLHGDTPKRGCTHGYRGHDRERGGKGRGSKRKDMGRSQYDSAPGWRRDRNEQSKTRKVERDDYKPAIYATEFPMEEIAAEKRKPKRKVAVMIGYSGSGYHGMQLNQSQKTIEGDLFQAFVKAGAVSKANADDPKKISFVRCARTDKGVHAAGNVISLKLIIEDPDIVQKINTNLSPQIRVWGIVRTANSFSAYNLCDSRIYEYLIPTHCFLPPHPKTYMGRRLKELGEEMNDLEGFNLRQQEVTNFWEETEERYVKPALETIEPHLRERAQRYLFESDLAEEGDIKESTKNVPADEAEITMGSDMRDLNNRSVLAVSKSSADEIHGPKIDKGLQLQETDGDAQPIMRMPKTLNTTEQAMRKLKLAMMQAKKDWRISPERLARVVSAFKRFEGVHNYHNYTRDKSYKDPSSKRVIKSFKVDENPILIGGTEWLSLKVHGQSFMMHQIRKMVGMATLVVRSGAHEARLQEAMGPEKMSIPRTPGLGLLLERPIFESYNQKQRNAQGGPERNDISFDEYQKEMDDFKQREIYDRIYREEEAGNVFHQLFWAIDNLRSSQYLYVSSKGLATREGRIGEEDAAVEAAVGEASADEDIDNEGG